MQRITSIDGGLRQVSPLIVTLKPKKSSKRDASFRQGGNRFREAKPLAQDCTASMSWSWESNTKSLTLGAQIVEAGRTQHTSVLVTLLQSATSN